MKQLIILLLLATAPFAKEQWQLIWSDEFNADGTPDSTKWSFDIDGNAWDWGNNEWQNYTSADNKNAWVENGSLIIEARQERNTAAADGETKEYTSARLRSLKKGDWLQGRFEIRAKLPMGVGTWPAIWMLPTKDTYGGWPHSGEIDIMEAIGSEPKTHYSTVWTTSSEATWGNGDTLTVSNRGTDFQTFALEWYEDSLLFFVDDKPVHRYLKTSNDPKEWPFDHQFHLLMNIAVGGDWEKMVDPASFPARMEVDYVRVYQLQHEPTVNAPGSVHGSLWLRYTDKGIELKQREGSFAEISIFNKKGKLTETKELGFIDEGTHTIYKLSSLKPGDYTAQVITSEGKGTIPFTLQ